MSKERWAVRVREILERDGSTDEKLFRIQTITDELVRDFVSEALDQAIQKLEERPGPNKLCPMCLLGLMTPELLGQEE